MDERIRRLVMSRPIPEALIRALELAPDVPGHSLDRWLQSYRQMPRTGRDERSHRPRAQVLTPRQARVLELAAAGLQRKQIAAAMEISEETVKNHLSHARFRLKAQTTAQAVATAIRRGLIG